MPKNRIPTPASTRAVHGSAKAPNFKPRNSGAIKATGTVTPKKVTPNKPANQGVSRLLFWRK